MRVLYKKIIRNRLAGFGAALISIICFLSLITPFLGLPDPNVIDTSKRFTMPLVDGYIFGADHLGRDILSRLLWGTRLSIFVGLVAALIAASIGSVIGILAGLYGGKADTLLMRSIDVLMAFPYILLALAIVAVLGPGLMNALIAVAIVNIPFFARNVRGVTLSLVQSDFIAAARLSGRNTFSILLFELLPNLVSVIIVAFSTTIGWMILETAGLSFLGLGSQPPQSDLGSMLGEARAALITHPHTSFIPGLMIFAIVMGINLLGDGIRDALDPRLAKGMLRRSQPITYIDRQKNISGTSIFAGLEGTRPILVEIQALVTHSTLATPRRVIVGWDISRLAMLCAVLEARCKIHLSNMDIFLNIAGGIKLFEPAADLAVAAAIISSVKNIPLSFSSVFFGEVGLSGEVRKVNQPELRIKEASKLGFNKINLPTKQKVIISEDMRYNNLNVLNDLVELINKDNRD